MKHRIKFSLPVEKKELKISNCMFVYSDGQNMLHDDYSFTYQSKKCTVDFFKKELLTKYSEDLEIYRDENGRTVLRIHESIPVFDSGDREWDSYRVLYIIKEEKTFTGIYLSGGYRLACVRKYTHIKCGDEKTKALFEKLKML